MDMWWIMKNNRKLLNVIWENHVKNFKPILITFCEISLPRGKGDRKAKMLIIGVC